MNRLFLRQGRASALERRHPWIFSGAVERMEGQLELGDTVEVLKHDGQWLARASYSPHSKIRARIWTWQAQQSIDSDYFKKRIERAIQARRSLHRDPAVAAYREVYAESDGIPGLVVDRYNDIRVVQFLTAGVERWREVIVEHLASGAGVESLYERSDTDVRALEGLPQRSGLLWGKPVPDQIVIHEYGLDYLVDIKRGHKTGFYLDQRENRKGFSDWVRPGHAVLNCFAYSGGFSLSALKAGAETVLSIDSSADALALAAQAVHLNELDGARCEWMQADVFSALRALRDRARSFDVIVLDPPKFAATPAHVERAARGYKDINLLAFKLLRPGGVLFTFSCSGGVSSALFQKIVADAALDAKADGKVLAWMAQPSDHPVSLPFPESRYLKGLICRKR